ncbi:hypothetical protein AMAG_02067 [Allomyces macrogynus ATCC 38327]|uniref:C2H2-type domain-containing protein n=1 Tax=Allomyces macrogynus (strain ATCC 38327) TaxID=578462 RepID=A0A0L0S1J2_ALLM3|nr:hypothetical protein AMAG_02067 [Allomyces macrogynus ATCC 38327]|eukprot:KNE56234.1 hypothetical protein AMAG_02067 [Allomyces macrogynus ATCC 38327]
MTPAPADLGPRVRALQAADAHFDLTAELDTIHARERAFCRDFRCCGATLADLYELLVRIAEHYEEYHLDADMAMFMALGHANNISNASMAPTAAANAAAGLLPGAAAADTRASLPNPLLDLIALHSTAAAPPASLHATAAPMAGPTRDPTAVNSANDIDDGMSLRPQQGRRASYIAQALTRPNGRNYVLSPPLSPAPVSTTHSRAPSTTGGPALLKRARTPASPASPSPRTLTGDADMANASPLTAALHKRRKSTHAATDRAHLRAFTIPAVSTLPSPSPSPGTDVVRPASVGPALGKFPALEPRAKSASPRPRDRQHARAAMAPGGSARSPLAKSVVVMGGDQPAAPVPFAGLVAGPGRVGDAPDQPRVAAPPAMSDSMPRSVSPTHHADIDTTTPTNQGDKHEDGNFIVTDEAPRPPTGRPATLPPRPPALPDPVEPLAMVTRHRAQLAALAKSTVVRAVSKAPPLVIPCPFGGCAKTYHSANGLKYHLTRMHSDERETSPAVSAPAAAAVGPDGTEPAAEHGAPAGAAGATGRRRNPAV